MDVIGVYGEVALLLLPLLFLAPRICERSPALSQKK